jgi:RNA polymerase sigma-70 factor (ECF subfamily)
MGTVSALDPRGPTDASLVLAARDGERWAFEALFRRHARMANGLAYRLLAGDQEIDDVVQDAFIAAFNRLHTLEEPAAFPGFLGTIVVRRARYVVRRRRLARLLGLMPAAEPLDVTGIVSRDAPPDALAELSAIYRVIDRLPASERLALLLRRVEGYSLDEVAAACGCSLATAKRRLTAAQAKLDARVADDHAVASDRRAAGGEKR